MCSASHDLGAGPVIGPRIIEELGLHVSPQPVFLSLLVLGPVLYAVTQGLFPSPEVSARLVLFSSILQLLSIAGWLLLGRNDQLARWYTIALLTGAIVASGLLLRMSGTLTLVAIPVALSAAMISVPAMTFAAIGVSVLVFALTLWGPAGVDLAAGVTSVIAVWGTVGAVHGGYRPIRGLAQWSWDYYRYAQNALGEGRDRQAELRQALEDLSDANTQLKRLHRLAHNLRLAAEEARTAKEQFVANVSHELRTPLNMVVGFSEVIVRAPETYGEGLPSALMADLAVIHRNAAHLSDLIDDVLELSQIDADQMPLSKEYVHIGGLIEGAVEAVRPLLASKNLYLKTELPGDLPPIFCDGTRIREVVLNLLSNAGRFTDHGGVTVRAWREQDDLVVSVADTGPGISPGNIDKLFQPFRQLDGSLRRRYAGTGLGLSISRRFVEMHGGKIWVDSAEGVGTTFFFRLPLAPPMPLGATYRRGLYPAWEFLQHTHASLAPQTTVRPRLLVLEDRASLQPLLARHLDGVEIVSAVDLGEVAQELLETPVDVLLVNDVSLSAALRRIESATFLGETPVIACPIAGTAEAAAGIGVFDYLVKPVSREALLRTLDRLHLDGKTVLVVDDEPDVLQLFRRMLTSSGAGYRVLRAGNGIEAMNILRARRPDAVLLDLVMPKMDGFRFLEKKSQDASLADIPVIAVSARDPTGQPIVSRGLAITRGGGLSVGPVLLLISMVVEILSATARRGDPGLRSKPLG